jgi:hypothetical protein
MSENPIIILIFRCHELSDRGQDRRLRSVPFFTAFRHCRLYNKHTAGHIIFFLLFLVG